MAGLVDPGKLVYFCVNENGALEPIHVHIFAVVVNAILNAFASERENHEKREKRIVLSTHIF